MRNDKNTAIKLRLAGKSYGEIQRTLKIPKSTLSSWLSQVVISDDAKRKITSRGRKASIDILIKRNRAQTALAISRARKTRAEAMGCIKSISQRDLLILGTALYWAEGYKRPLIRNGKEATWHQVSLTNSDPLLVKLFVRFLLECLQISINNIKIALRMFDHQNEENLKIFWQKTTGIPLENFLKTYKGISLSSKGKRPFNRLEFGIVQITVARTSLFHKIMGYIEGIKKIV